MGLYIGPLTKLGSWKRLIATSIRMRVAAMRWKENDERPGHRIEESARRPERRLGLFALHHRVGLERFGAPGSMAVKADAHQQAIKNIGLVPADALGDGQDHRFARQQRGAIAECVGGGEKAQLVRYRARFRSARHRWRCPGSRTRKPPPARRRPAGARPWPVPAQRHGDQAARRSPICASSIQPRRRPSTASNGAPTRSSSGAQRNFSE